MLVCTVLPTYNEHENIVPLIQRLLASVPPPYLILVVDDGSPDGTADKVATLAEEVNAAGFRRLALIRRHGERGLTSAIQRGIDEATRRYGAGIVTWMDCDLSMPPETVPALISAISEDGADVAVGSRWAPGGADEGHGPLARGLSWILNHFAMTLLGDTVHDYTSGFIAVRARVLADFASAGTMANTASTCWRGRLSLGYRLQEVPYVCIPRYQGESKTGANLWEYIDRGGPYVATILVAICRAAPPGHRRPAGRHQ